MNIVVENSSVWVNLNYFKKFGISDTTVRCWKSRKTENIKTVAGRRYINYDTIPEPTRQKLPSKESLINQVKTEQLDERSQYFYNEIYTAYNSIDAAAWCNKIKEHVKKDLSADLLKTYARKAAVFSRILQIYEGNHGDLKCLHNAYLRLFPDGYKQKRHFCTLLKKAKSDIFSVVIDRRQLTTGNHTEKDPRHAFFAEGILSSKTGYSQTMAYRKQREACVNEGITPLSFSWFRKYCKTSKNRIDASRFGATAYEKENGKTMKLQQALYTGDQWQIDGWEIPLYYKKQNKAGTQILFNKAVLFAVLDAHSRKIIGFRIDESENTDCIMKGLEKAVFDTGIVPYEIVSDNHSFNKTKEAGNFKEKLERHGNTWTVDSNPRRKVLIERMFKTLGEIHFKEVYGYLGQGVKTKEKNGRPPQELLDEYGKALNQYTFDEIITITQAIINQYNNTVIQSLGDTPNNMYDSNNQPHARKIDEFEQVALFFRKTEHTARHGQINIEFKGNKREFEIPKSFHNINNQKVTVRYRDYNEGIIYIYDKDTDKGICKAKEKAVAHAALANQTKADRDEFYKNSARIKFIKNRQKEEKEAIINNAVQYNPDCVDTLNKITTSKDIIKDLQQRKDIQAALKNDYGFNPENIKSYPGKSETCGAFQNPKAEKEISRPFQVKGDKELKFICLSELDELCKTIEDATPEPDNVPLLKIF